MIYKKRHIKLPQKSSYFLMGVRGSGKTALLKRRFPKALYIDLLDQSLYHQYLSKISLFYEQVKAFKTSQWVIVDEIQKMPMLLNEVHRLIEEKAFSRVRRYFILTGSSSRKLKNQKDVNLLAGRAGAVSLHPFLPKELGADFNLTSALQYGLLPVVWSSDNKELSLKGYATKYLAEEIKAEALVRNLPGFARFLEVAALYHGQLINMNSIARECQISRQSAASFFSILEDTMLGFFLPAYSSKLKLREKKHKKFYFVDPGLARALKNNFGPVSIEEKGFLFEGLTAQILRACKDYYSLCDSMFYWAPSDTEKTEVDFLLKKGKNLIAIEVKSQKHISSQDYKGLKAVQKIRGIKRKIIVYLGTHQRETQEGIEIQPFDVFCQHCTRGLF